MVKTYSSKDVIVTFGGNPIQGLADGTFVNIVKDEDSYTKVTGADGQTSRAKNPNRSCRVTLTLKQTSSSNDVLSGVARLDQVANAGVLPIQIKDLLGTTIFSAPEAWIVREPDQDFGKEINDRAWMIDTGAADIFVGGNN